MNMDFKLNDRMTYEYNKDLLVKSLDDGSYKVHEEFLYDFMNEYVGYMPKRKIDGYYICGRVE